MKNVVSIIVFCALLPFCQRAQAVSEADYAANIHDQVLPFISAHLENFYFQSFDGKRIHYAFVRTPGSRGTIVLVPGRAESIIGFREIVYDLARTGYSIAIIDHRGQGQSQKLVADSSVGHVDHFQDYVKDFEAFVDQHVRTSLPAPYYLVGTSMGSAISTFYLLNHPNVFRKAALAVPMYKILTSWISNGIVSDILASLDWAGMATDFSPGQSAYDPNLAFEGNLFTHSRWRFEFDKALARFHPEIAIGGASVRWAEEALNAASVLRASATKLKTPVLMIQAGDDQIVANDAVTDFCKTAQNCQLLTMPGADHWIFMETDSIRNYVFGKILGFFATLDR